MEEPGAIRGKKARYASCEIRNHTQGRAKKNKKTVEKHKHKYNCNKSERNTFFSSFGRGLKHGLFSTRIPSIQISIKKDPSLNVHVLPYEQIPHLFFRLNLHLKTSPKINQSKTPMNTMTTSCFAIIVSTEWEITKWTWLDENVTFGDGSMDPACVVKSENESGSFTPVKNKIKSKV